MKRFFVILIFVLILSFGGIKAHVGTASAFHGSRSLHVDANASEPDIWEERHGLIRFKRIPSAQDRANLAGQGITLQEYLGNNAYSALFQNAVPARLPAEVVRNISAIDQIPAQLKLSSTLQHPDSLNDFINSEGLVPLYVRFHEDISFDEATGIIRVHGFDLEQKDYYYYRTILIYSDESRIAAIAGEDSILRISLAYPFGIESNESAAGRSRVDAVYNKKIFGNPTGASINVGIWDEGSVGGHVDLDGRISIVDDEPESTHSTHVAGTIGGSGKLSKRALGVAPASNMYSLHRPDSLSAMASYFDSVKNGFNNMSLHIANNSWISPAGWLTVFDEGEVFHVWLGNSWYGIYHEIHASGDRLVREKDIPLVYAAGNPRNDAYLGPHYKLKNPFAQEWDIDPVVQEVLRPIEPDFGSVIGLGVGKNTIMVGATMDDDGMTSFSAWGPTRDGRIKPDVVTNGYMVYSTYPDNTYGYLSGTSMSAPVATGIAALLMEQHKKLFGSIPGAARLKALLVHSARDLGTTGPDYKYGYGLMDAELAAHVLNAVNKFKNTRVRKGDPAAKKDSVLSANILEGTFEKNKETVSYTFTVPKKSKELRVTLVWNDVDGPKLINDLDIWATAPGSRKKLRPYTLNPAKPELEARNKRNKRDNVEHLHINDPEKGEWTISVKSNKLRQGPQNYVVIISAGKGNSKREIPEKGKLTVSAVYTTNADKSRSSDFTVGDTLNLQAEFDIVENESFGNFYGTVLVEFGIESDGKTVFRRFEAYDDFAPSTSGSPLTKSIGPYVVPSGMKPGNYTVRVTATMTNGSSDSRSTMLTVKD